MPRNPSILEVLQCIMHRNMSDFMAVIQYLITVLVKIYFENNMR